jgi:hypothetical protein
MPALAGVSSRPAGRRISIRAVATDRGEALLVVRIDGRTVALIDHSADTAFDAIESVLGSAIAAVAREEARR